MGPFSEDCNLTVEDLVKDLARLLVAELILLYPLPGGKGAQRRGGHFGDKWKRLKTRENAVTAENAHEPGKTGCRQGAAGDHTWKEPQGGESDTTPPINPLHRCPAAGQLGRGDRP